MVRLDYVIVEIKNIKEKILMVVREEWKKILVKDEELDWCYIF